MARALGAIALILALSGCGGGSGDVADARQPLTSGAGGGPGREVATVVRGAVTSTVVLNATVTAGPEFVVTAPSAGAYRVDRGRITYRTRSGTTQSVHVPRGVEVVDPLTAPGAHVPANYPVATARVTGFALVATLDDATTYRLYSSPVGARGEITEGPGPFDCPLANSVPLAAGGAPSSESPLTLTCVVPQRLKVFSGMGALMAVTTGVAEDVPLLPVEAVAGSAQQGSVSVLDKHGRAHVRHVELGVTDGSRIEIRSGLGVGARVLVPGPDLMPRGTSNGA